MEKESTTLHVRNFPLPPSYSNFWSILSQHLFLQKMNRNDVLSERKVLAPAKVYRHNKMTFHKSFGLIRSL